MQYVTYKHAGAVTQNLPEMIALAGQLRYNKIGFIYTNNNNRDNMNIITINNNNNIIIIIIIIMNTEFKATD